mmetsp:Transcript_24545/g.38486  ORF Transcript_24545/g.38486 Transcript_24545/m.38486 type:complete len:206 (-) Transcript_24545:338-955(-)
MAHSKNMVLDDKGVFGLQTMFDTYSASHLGVPFKVRNTFIEVVEEESLFQEGGIANHTMRRNASEPTLPTLLAGVSSSTLSSKMVSVCTYKKLQDCDWEASLGNPTKLSEPECEPEARRSFQDSATNTEITDQCKLKETMTIDARTEGTQTEKRRRRRRRGSLIDVAFWSQQKPTPGDAGRFCQWCGGSCYQNYKFCLFCGQEVR